jgi:hypothetical protein
MPLSSIGTVLRDSFSFGTDNCFFVLGVTWSLFDNFRGLSCPEKEGSRIALGRFRQTEKDSCD